MLALVSALCLSLAPAPPSLPTDSLQDFLRRARAEQSRVLDALRADVLTAVTRMEALSGTTGTLELDAARASLRAGGRASAPLLVAFIDAGPDPGDGQTFRATEVAAALADLGIQSVVRPLLELARTSNRPARVRALGLLAGAPKDPAIDAFLEDQARSATGPIRHAALAAVVGRGTPGAGTLIDEALADGDGTALSTIFEALAGINPAFANSVLVRAFGNTKYVESWIDPALERCLEQPQPLSSEVLSALGELLADSSRSNKLKVTVLDKLSLMEPSSDKQLKRNLQALVESTDDDVRNGALVCLALLGDRGAKRDLLRDLDDLVSNNQRWAPAYEQRGDMLLRIREYSDAVKDFKNSIDIDESSRRGVQPATREKLARAYAGAGKLKNAFETLDAAGLTQQRLAQLSEEPVFRDLREHARYGKVFQP